MPSSLDLRHPKCACCAEFASPHAGRSREYPRVLLIALFLLCIVCTSCGAVGSSAPPPPVTVSVTPSSASPYPGEPVQFSATVQNAANTAVTWQVNQTAGGNSTVGMIDANGLYTAPALVPNPRTVTVTAVSQSESSSMGSSIVTILSVSSSLSITLTPALSSVTTSQPLLLSLTPSTVSNKDVNWAVDGFLNGNSTVGTFSTVGLPSNSVEYIPPQTQGSHTITATMNQGPTASATVYVTTFPGTLTWRNDNMRSGVNNQELLLSPSTVTPATFGKLFSCPIDGYAYAQPLYVPNLAIAGMGTHNVIFVATEMDSVYAFDADTSPCLQLWKTSLIPPGSQPVNTPNFLLTNTDIVPFVGITGTPVIDPKASILYAVAESQTTTGFPNICSNASTYCHFLFAVDLATGQLLIRPSGTGIATPEGLSTIFLPTIENQRPALLLDNGAVYIGFGSFGGQGDYHGWLFAYDPTTLLQTGVFDVSPSAFQGGGIWQSGGGPSADSSGNVFAVTGNGLFDVNRGGTSYGNSFLRFGTNGGLTVADYFTPCNQEMLQAQGLGVGSSAPVLLPDSAGSSSQPHLLVGASAGGSLYVVNRDSMGKYVADACPDSSIRVQTISVPGGEILSTPVYWNGAVYVASANANLMSFSMSGGALASSPSAAQSPESFGPQGATPVISSNGTSNAILWLIDTSGALATPANTPAILRAYDPNNLSNEIYNSTMAAASRDVAGVAVKFTVPTVANGKVYVGTQTELDVYGLK